MILRGIQALALHDAGVYGGAFCPIGVGDGKTLISFLAPVVCRSERPLLLMPASLIEKTQRDRLRYAEHFEIPNTLRIVSNESLGLVQNERFLEEYGPDLIIIDEGHKYKNKRAARTRRLARYMYSRPQTKVVILSGTVMDKSLKEFAHLLLWALKLGAPVPKTVEEIEEWAAALDVEIDPMARWRAGALLEFCSPEERKQDDTTAARNGFRRRLIETPGVVATIGEGERVNCSIYVTGHLYDVKPITDQYIARIRSDMKTPDDWQLMTAAEKWEHVQQMALGLYYKWDPRPPEDWREARRAWHSFVRDTISRSKKYDSELHVANACDAGDLDDSTLVAWRAVRPTFTPYSVPVWFDDSALEWCAKWMREPGIVWTGHRFFGERLSQVTGVPYFGAQGLDRKGRYIEDASSKQAVIASIDANREGKNLQELWNRNLVVCPPSSSEWCEQVIARTHRPGQKADEVIVDILIGCRENFDAVQKALERAKAVQQMTGKTQKLLIADLSLPSESEIDALRSARWVK